MDTPPRKTPLAGPVFRAVLAFAAGILVEGGAALAPLPLALALGAAILCAAILRKRETAGDLSVFCALVLAGMFALAAQTSLRGPAVIPEGFAYRRIVLTGTVTGESRIRSGGTFFTLACGTLATADSSYGIRGTIPCALYGRKVSLAEGATLTARGTVVSLRGPVERSVFTSLPRPGAPRDRFVIDPSGITILAEGGSRFGAARRAVAGLVSSYDFGGHRDLLLALTIGYVRDLSPETRDTFARSGIAHLLAVSGMNVGVVAATVLFVLGLFPLKRRLRLIAAGCLLFLYAGVCGFNPPVTRALVMAVMILGSFLLERPRQAENTLFAALLVILACDPSSISGASLQLSFAAAWTLTTLYRPAAEFLRIDRITNAPVRWMCELLIATGLASLATAPITAAHFGFMPFLSLPANLPGVPLSSVITVAGMAAIGIISLGPLFAPVAGIMAFLTGLLLSLLALIAECGAALPFASIDPGAVTPLFAIAFAAWLYVLSRSRGRPRFRKLLLYIPMTTCLIWTWNPLVGPAAANNRGYAVFFSVGQGDAALVACGERRFLIDTGPSFSGSSPAETVLLPSLRALGAGTLDGLVLSHTDSDHSGGLDTIVREAKVERIFCRSSIRDSLAALYGERVYGVDAGDSVSFGGGGFVVLAPSTGDPRLRSENDSSCVVRFSCGGSTVLFTGDIGGEVQRTMTAWDGRLRADILKVPHHGAAGIDSGFLDAVSPEVSVISCGANNIYGHPAQSTVEALGETGGRVLRTDRNGTVVVLFPGMKVETER
jgi:competence protein ComEC